MTWPNRSRTWCAALGLAVIAQAAAAASGGLLRQLSSEIADTVDRVMPSVVVVRTEATRYYRAFDWAFGRSVVIPERLAGLGSGVIIDAEGHVLTSAHVVQGAQQITLALSNGREMKAEPVGIDPSTDLAVLRLVDAGAEEIVPIAMGDSDAVRVGEIVIAVGSPFSLSSSVTLGILSQKQRSVGLLPFEDFLQTDAPINPGNSGGPLVDVDGRLIGINAVIQTGGPNARGNLGIGFAVPVNLARRVADSILRNGYFARPWIGIRPSELPPARGSGAPEGVVVEAVFEGTPAAEKGMLEGDVIVSIQGQPVRSLQDLQRGILESALGTPLRLVVHRGGADIELRVPTVAVPGAVRRRGRRP